MDDNIKEAFLKVKEDIFYIKQDLESLRASLNETRTYLSNLSNIIQLLNKKTDNLIKIKEENIENKQLTTSTQKQESSTIQQDNPTNQHIFKPLNNQISSISIGNEGVPTDRQTDQQTDQHIDKGSYNIIKEENKDSIGKASEILDSLDNIKKDIRLKFKRLTDQEILVFSTIYQLDEEIGYSDYKSISERLSLTESSIRDYVGRLIKKGIPIDKNKINNKTIHLNISQNLKKIASLNTLLKLRDI